MVMGFLYSVRLSGSLGLSMTVLDPLQWRGQRLGFLLKNSFWALRLSNTVSLIKGSLSISVTLPSIFMLAVPTWAHLSQSFYPDSCNSTLTICASAQSLGVKYNQLWVKFPISWITKKYNLSACFSSHLHFLSFSKCNRILNLKNIEHFRIASLAQPIHVYRSKEVAFVGERWLQTLEKVTLWKRNPC